MLAFPQWMHQLHAIIPQNHRQSKQKRFRHFASEPRFSKARRNGIDIQFFSELASPGYHLRILEESLERIVSGDIEVLKIGGE
jgi:hypothetical protein